MLFEQKEKGGRGGKKNAHPANAKGNGKLASEGPRESEHRRIRGYLTARRIQIRGLNTHLVPW